MSAFERCTLPCIAAVHGACVGAGVDLATACDIRLATADASFSVKARLCFLCFCLACGFHADISSKRSLAVPAHIQGGGNATRPYRLPPLHLLCVLCPLAAYTPAASFATTNRQEAHSPPPSAPPPHKTQEADLAIVADMGTLQRLPTIVGHGVAAELALTARTFSGASSWGGGGGVGCCQLAPYPLTSPCLLACLQTGPEARELRLVSQAFSMC